MVALQFAVNLAANLIFSPIQFGLRKFPLAAIDILIVWVSTATAVQPSITFWNWRR